MQGILEAVKGTSGAIKPLDTVVEHFIVGLKKKSSFILQALFSS